MLHVLWAKMYPGERFLAEKSYYEDIKQKKLKTVTITQTTVDYAIRFLCRQSLTLYEYSLISCFRDHIDHVYDCPHCQGTANVYCTYALAYHIFIVH